MFFWISLNQKVSKKKKKMFILPLNTILVTFVGINKQHCWKNLFVQQIYFPKKMLILARNILPLWFSLFRWRQNFNNLQNNLPFLIFILYLVKVFCRNKQNIFSEFNYKWERQNPHSPKLTFNYKLFTRLHQLSTWSNTSLWSTQEETSQTTV